MPRCPRRAHRAPAARVPGGLGRADDPDLPFGRLRANRQLLEIGRDELAFDAEETRALAASTGYPLDRDQAEALAERTEGWAAAIYLASLARGRPEARVVERGDVSGRESYIADYLRSELRPILDDRDVTLLTRTAILDAVEPGLAEAVSGMPDAQERLRRLAHANLLISEVTGPRDLVALPPPAAGSPACRARAS